MASAAGRDPDSLVMSMRVEVEVHGKPSSQRAQGRSRLPGNDIEEMIAGIRAYESAGVQHIVLALNSGDVPKLTAWMENIAKQVMPQFR